MSYVGRPPEYGGYEKQDITPDGSTTTFALNFTVGTESSLLVSVAGVIQQPGVGYTLSGGGGTVVFSAAPASTATVFVIFLGFSLDAGNAVNTGSITSQTAVTSLQNVDKFLVYDNSAAALRKGRFSICSCGIVTDNKNSYRRWKYYRIYSNIRCNSKYSFSFS